MKVGEVWGWEGVNKRDLREPTETRNEKGRKASRTEGKITSDGRVPVLYSGSPPDHQFHIQCCSWASTKPPIPPSPARSSLVTISLLPKSFFFPLFFLFFLGPRSLHMEIPRLGL